MNTTQKNSSPKFWKRLLFQTLILTITFSAIVLGVFSLGNHFKDISNPYRGKTERHLMMEQMGLTSSERQTLMAEFDAIFIEIDRETSQRTGPNKTNLSQKLTQRLITLSENLEPDAIYNKDKATWYIHSKERGELFRKLISSGDEFQPVLQKGNFEYALLDEIDLTSKTLTGCRLMGAWLRGAKLNGADLQKANLNKAILDNATIRQANLSNIKMQDARLRDVSLDNSNLEKAILTGSNFRRASMQHVNLSDATLIGTNLAQVDLTHSTLDRINLEKSSIVNSNCSNIKMIQGNLTDAYLSHVCMDKSNLMDNNFTTTLIRDSSFNKSDLSDSTFERTSLSRVYFERAVIRTSLFSAGIQNSFFYDTDMSGTNFDRASFITEPYYNEELSDTSFSGAILDYAIFSFGAFHGVKKGENLTFKSITGACWLDGKRNSDIKVISPNPSDSELKNHQQQILDRYEQTNYYYKHHQSGNVYFEGGN
jgi:uncharacterized protein YjbI with pentapeptide repeats